MKWNVYPFGRTSGTATQARTSDVKQNMPLTIRPATPADFPSIRAIYDEVVANSFAIYEEGPVSEERVRSWFDSRRSAGFPFLVADSGGEVVAYATFGTFRAATCYKSSVEHAVHVKSGHRGRGIGGKMMRELIAVARESGYHVMIGAIDSANEGSLELHRRLGFAETGRLPQVARKNGQWRDLVFMQLSL